jgi:hypothetical protein
MLQRIIFNLQPILLVIFLINDIHKILRDLISIIIVKLFLCPIKN